MKVRQLRATKSAYRKLNGLFCVRSFRSKENSFIVLSVRCARKHLQIITVYGELARQRHRNREDRFVLIESIHESIVRVGAETYLNFSPSLNVVA